jgi:dihydroneopterin aldolase
VITTAYASQGLRHVFVRDYVMQARIGVHAHEFNGPQRVRLNLDLAVLETEAPIGDHLRNVVDYDAVIKSVRQVVEAGHVKLLETLAESIAQQCLTDSRIQRVRVQLEKLDVYADMQSVGIAIERKNTAKMLDD